MNAEIENAVTPPPMKSLVKIVRHKRTLKVHQANANFAPLCGGGNGGKSVLGWQEDIGPANCGRCQQITEKKKAKTYAHTTV